MANVVVIDDYVEYSEATADLIRRSGHDVLAIAIEHGPINFEQVIQFGAQVIVLALYKRRLAFGRHVEDPQEDVLGYAVLKQLETYPVINLIPIILVATFLDEQEIPTSVNYDLFLALPDDIKMLLPKVEELGTKVKSRRKISDYLCPVCRSRLTYVTRRDSLFCPRCAAAVSVIDEKSCHALNGKGQTVPCTMDMLRGKPHG